MKLPKNFFCTVFLLIGILFAWQANAAVPNAINNLNCVYSGIVNSLTLTWSVPSGNPTSYDVRYGLSDISASDFDNALQFWQNWPGNATEGQVNFLTQGKTWYFAIKSVNASGTSEISNTAYCYLLEAVDNSDKEAPSSLITSPESGSDVQAGKDYLIKGISSDSGGSSVKQVEISIDGCNIWQKVTPKESVNTGFSWEYIWQKPTPGLYLIKTRATDWWQNIETDNAGISIQVVSGVSAATSSPENATIAPSQEALRAQIIAIQQQIIQLVLQLINLLKAGA